MPERNIILNMCTQWKREGEYQKAIRKKMGEVDGVVVHKRYANRAKSQNQS